MSNQMTNRNDEEKERPVRLIKSNDSLDGIKEAIKILEERPEEIHERITDFVESYIKDNAIKKGRILETIGINPKNYGRWKKAKPKQINLGLLMHLSLVTHTKIKDILGIDLDSMPELYPEPIEIDTSNIDIKILERCRSFTLEMNKGKGLSTTKLMSDADKLAVEVKDENIDQLTDSFLAIRKLQKVD